MKKKKVCPKCGSKHTVGHGYYTNVTGRWHRMKCQACGRTFYEDKMLSEGGKA